MKQKKPKRFSTDLAGMQSQCDSNYLYLMHLIADWDAFDRIEFAIDSGDSPASKVIIKQLERNPYTTTISVEQQDVLLPWVSGPLLSVRVYHDARMAEVISWNRHRNLQAKYPYPNKQMYLPDEKNQLNQFLGEWLKQCRQYGRILEPVELS